MCTIHIYLVSSDSSQGCRAGRLDPEPQCSLGVGLLGEGSPFAGANFLTGAALLCQHGAGVTSTLVGTERRVVEKRRAGYKARRTRA